MVGFMVQVSSYYAFGEPVAEILNREAEIQSLICVVDVRLMDVRSHGNMLL